MMSCSYFEFLKYARYKQFVISIIQMGRTPHTWRHWCSARLNNLPSVPFSSVAQLCLTLCDPMDCRHTRFPVCHQLPELAQTHVHLVGDAIQPSHPLPSLSPRLLLMINDKRQKLTSSAQKRKSQYLCRWAWTKICKIEISIIQK